VATYEHLDLGPRPFTAKPGHVWRLAAGPGRSVTFEEAVQLAEQAAAASDMGVLSAKEMEFGWVLVLQSRQYIATRSFSDQLVGHGITIVDGRTGDVYWSGSATPPWDAIVGFLAARPPTPPQSGYERSGR